VDFFADFDEWDLPGADTGDGQISIHKRARAHSHSEGKAAVLEYRRCGSARIARRLVTP
jgi:hypothetical protein